MLLPIGGWLNIWRQPMSWSDGVAQAKLGVHRSQTCQALFFCAGRLVSLWKGFRNILLLFDSIFTTKGLLDIYNKGITCSLEALVAQLDAPSDWRPGGSGFNPRRGRQHSFVEFDHELFWCRVNSAHSKLGTQPTRQTSISRPFEIIKIYNRYNLVINGDILFFFSYFCSKKPER